MGIISAGSFLGGGVMGTSTAGATQSATVTFLPTVSDQSQPFVSPYPAGQGLASLNSAYPGSAAYAPASSGAAGSLTLWVLLAAAAAAAYFFFVK